jgi:hypothetical protein
MRQKHEEGVILEGKVQIRNEKSRLGHISKEAMWINWHNSSKEINKTKPLYYNT